jgi:hypothetical protein
MTWKSDESSRSSSAARAARVSSKVTNGSSRTSGGRRPCVTSLTRPMRAARKTWSIVPLLS